MVLSPPVKTNHHRLDRGLAVVALITLVAAWLIGNARSAANLEIFLPAAFPGAGRFEKTSEGVYRAYSDGSPEQMVGYVAISEGNGYGGPMTVAVGVNLQGRVVGLTIIDSKDTASWLEKVNDSKYISSLLGKSYADSFVLGEDVDGVTGATYTSRAIAEAALQGSRKIAGNELDLVLPAKADVKIQFGIPEIVLIALFATGYFGHQSRFKYTKQARWATMLIGLVVIGFIYNSPLTLASINKFLMGFWPEWQTHLYWYLLIGGILFVFTVDNKNPYCQWFCPFGAAQECLGAIGGAKIRSTGRYHHFLKWLQRGLAWFAIVVALLFRNPGITSFEIFGTLFNLTGTLVQFALLGIILVASLFIKRPWCDYLCPIHPIDEFIRLVRGWILEIWKTLRIK